MSLDKLATPKQINVRSSARDELGTGLTSFVSPTLITARSQDEHSSQGAPSLDALSSIAANFGTKQGLCDFKAGSWTCSRLEEIPAPMC